MPRRITRNPPWPTNDWNSVGPNHDVKHDRYFAVESTIKACSRHRLAADVLHDRDQRRRRRQLAIQAEGAALAPIDLASDLAKLGGDAM